VVAALGPAVEAGLAETRKEAMMTGPASVVAAVVAEGEDGMAEGRLW
jgi:hypothetical protein